VTIRVEMSLDNFAQSGETTRGEITKLANQSGGKVANIIRDPNTGKVVFVNLTFPDGTNQAAIDAVIANKGVATVIQFPKVLLDQKFDGMTVGADLPPANAYGSWFKDPTISSSFAVANDQSVSSPNALKSVHSGTGTSIEQARLYFQLQTAPISAGRVMEYEFNLRTTFWPAVAGIFFEFKATEAAYLTTNFRFFGFGTGLLKLQGSTWPGMIVPAGSWHNLKVQHEVGTPDALVFLDGSPQTPITDHVIESSDVSVLFIDSGSNGGSSARSMWVDDIKWTILS